jgi:Fe2+ transport system protein FeoA
VQNRDPFDGPLTVQLDNGPRILGAGVAGSILVERE